MLPTHAPAESCRLRGESDSALDQTTVDGASRPLRIGIITDGLEERVVDGQVQIANGGVGVYIDNLVRHLRRVDPVNDYFLIRHGPGALGIYERAQPVFLRRSVLARVLIVLDVSYRRSAANLRLDVLHFPNQFGGAFVGPHVKRVVTLHDMTPLLFPHYHPWRRVVAYRLLMHHTLRTVDRVIVDSAHTRADLAASARIPVDKITVVPLAAADHFRPTTPTAAFAGRYDLPARFIFTVGVLEPRKNHGLLVEALRRLQAAGEQIGLVIVGREGWRWKDPLAAPSVAPLRSCVRIFRNVPDDDLVEFYNRAAVFAYPSLYEGFGLPLLEAMACGTPVVASARSSLPEVAGDAALLADPEDVDDFTAQLLRVLRDPALRRRLIDAGRRRARHFSWRQTAERTLAVYEEVCGRPRHRLEEHRHAR